MKCASIKTLFPLTFILLASSVFSQTVFYNEPFNANNGWTLGANWAITSGELKLSYLPIITSYNTEAISPIINVPVDATDLIISMYIDEYILQGTPPETYEITALVYGTTPVVLWTYNSNTDWGSSGGTNLTLPISQFQNQEILLRFRASGVSTNYFDYWHIYSILGYYNQPILYDLAAVSIQGNGTPSVGTISNYQLKIQNNGLNEITGSQYSVKLMKEGDIEIASIPGYIINSGQSLTFTIPWNPNQTGSTYIYGKVVYTIDQNQANNQTANLNISVQPAGTCISTIGNGNELAHIPMDFYYKNSLYECIYLFSEFDGGGIISSISFYSNFLDNLSAKPTKIWLGPTTQTNLSSGWIPSSQLVAVFDGVVDYPSGINTITIPLTTPFVYTGSNLAMLVQRPMDTLYYDYNDLFYCQTVGTDRALHVYSDYTQFDPANPPVTLLSSQFPKTSFHFMAYGAGLLIGLVTSGGNPLQGATISVGGMPFTATSSFDGSYYFSALPPGQVQVTCTKTGYQTITSTVSIIANQVTTLNFMMTAIPVVNVTGTVIGSDNPAGLSGATVTLTGAATYSAVTNAQGQFTITDVIPNHSYAATITKAGYYSYSGTIAVGSTNHNMGTIIMNELSYPPTNVQAIESLPYVNLTWSAPNSSGHYFTDSFETYTDFALAFPPWTNVDVDQANTYAYQGYNWTNYTNPKAYMVFNPSATTPPFPTAIMSAHSGSKMAICWDSNGVPNNDWLISPQITVPPGGVISFWARSLTDLYDLEQFKVGVSTTGTLPADFTIISGVGYIYAPSDWTLYMYDLNAYAGQIVRIGIQCVSDDSWAFMVDDFTVDAVRGSLTTAIPAGKLLSASPQNMDKQSIKTSYLKERNNKKTSSNAFPVIERLPANNDRSLLGYKVWRLPVGQETNEAAWIQLTPNVITPISFTDDNWFMVPDGTYKWAVKAVYTNNLLSTAAFSNALQKVNQTGTLTGSVFTSTGTPIYNATISAASYVTNSNTAGFYSMDLPVGTYTVVCYKTGYASLQTTAIIANNQTTTQDFQLSDATPITDGFETYPDFAMYFSPWINVDNDQSNTYGYSTFDFPGEESPMSFIVFNPYTTTPASVTVMGVPHGGLKMATCFAAPLNPYGAGPNNDWLISQTFYSVGNNASISFWARSLTANYGLDRFRVMISTGASDPSQFILLAGDPYIEAPVSWTQYTFTIPSLYYDVPIRIAINCVSNGSWVLMIDDFVYNPGTVLSEDNITPITTTDLKGNYPNPFNPQTTISYEVKGNLPVVVEIYNLKGQKVKTLVNETKSTGQYEVKWNGTDENNHKVTSGVYLYKMTAGKYSSTRKMMLMK